MNTFIYIFIPKKNSYRYKLVSKIHLLSVSVADKLRTTLALQVTHKP